MGSLGLGSEHGGESSDVFTVQGESVINGLLEVAAVEGSRIFGRFTPDSLAIECMGNQTHSLEQLESDCFDVHELAGDARMYKEEIQRQMVMPSAPDHGSA